MVLVGIGQKEIKTEWPVEEGLELETTRLREDFVLEPEINLLLVKEEKRLN